MPTLFARYQFDIRVRFFNTPRGIRIPVASVKGMCPRPLDDGGVLRVLLFSTFIKLTHLSQSVNYFAKVFFYSSES